MITIVVTYVFPAGAEADAERHMHALGTATREEPGCRAFSVHRSLETPRTYLFFEQYEDRAALDAHRATPHYEQHAKNGLQTMMESRVASTYEPIE